MDMFVEQSQKIFIHESDNLYEDLYHFLVKIKDIYKTKLGSAVIEILISHQQIEARETFMTDYFNSNRRTLKKIISKHIKDEEQDSLDENYIEKMLKRIIEAYEPETKE